MGSIEYKTDMCTQYVMMKYFNFLYIYMLLCFNRVNVAVIVLLQDTESQFIMPEGASQRRGRFELAFSQIGGSVCVGQ